jgi:hypothetical protein
VRLIIITLVTLIIATIVGLGTTWMTATRGVNVGTIKIGAWTARPKTGTSDIDPYSRASVARSGELPDRHRRRRDVLGHDGRHRTQALDGRCDVNGERRHAGRAVLDHDDVRPEGTSRRQLAPALRLHQPGNRARIGRQLRASA